MKPAFSFIEVIISVAILSYLGTAILNFNSFNKKAMFNNIKKQNTLLVSSPLLYKDIENNKNYTLFDLVSFKNLSDSDNRFLKSIKLNAKVKSMEKLFLYNDGKKDYFMEYSDVKINYKQNPALQFVSIQRAK